MELVYHKSHSSEYPELVDTTSSKTSVYLRKNVQPYEIDVPEGDKITGYEYDECILTKDEYSLYCSLYQIEQQANVTTTELQLAIAELAELILQ